MCNMCKCCVKQSKYDLDRKIPLSGEGTYEKQNLQVLCESMSLDWLKLQMSMRPAIAAANTSQSMTPKGHI